MKKNHLLFIILTIFVTFTALEDFDYELLISRSGNVAKYTSYSFLQADKEYQDDALETLLELLDKYELSVVYHEQTSSLTTTRMHINDKKAMQGFILADGSIASDLNSRDFYYSTFSDNKNELLYSTDRWGKQEYVPISTEVFGTSSVPIFFSNSYNFDKEIRDIRDILWEQYGDKASLAVSSVRDNEYRTTNENISIAILGGFLACMIMLYTYIKNRRMISILKLEGHGNFKIFNSLVFKHVVITVLLSVITGLIVSTSSIPFNIVFRGGIHFLTSNFLSSMGIALLMYIVLSLIILFLISKTKVYQNKSNVAKDKSLMVMMPIKIAVIVLLIMVVTNGIEGIKSVTKSLYYYSDKMQLYANIIEVNDSSYKILEDSAVLEERKKIVNSFLDQYTNFTINLRNSRSSGPNKEDDFEISYCVVDDKYLEYQGVNYDMGDSKLLIVYPKGTTDAFKEDFKNNYRRGEPFSEETLLEITLDKNVKHYSPYTIEESFIVSDPIIYNIDSSINYTTPVYVESKNLIIDIPYEDFINEYNSFKDSLDFELDLSFVKLSESYSGNFLSRLNSWTRSIIEISILAVGILIYNYLIMYLLKEKYNEKTLSKNTVYRYVITQLIIIITGTIILYFMKYDLELIKTVLVWYLALDIAFIVASYLSFKNKKQIEDN